MFLVRLFVLAVLSTFVYGHFQLQYPVNRGFIASIEAQAPCGGFNVVNTTRTYFPLGSTYMKLHNGHPEANIIVWISFDENPQNLTAFTNTTSGAAQTPVRDWFQITNADVCLGVDIGAIGYPEAKDGANATISIIYNAGETPLYQCADITLSSTATIPSNYTCTDEYSTTASTPSATSSQGGAIQKAFSISGGLLATFGLSMLLV